uniref:Uncharacterized protein n=2 Tax=Equus TaxID=9789 RepID=A0A9L0SKV9_HORSE
VPRWKLLEILLRRPSVQTTCSGQCRCTVVCTLVRLGKGEQRHGQLETELLFPRRRHLLAPFSNLTPSVFLHRFCTLGTKKLARTLLRQDCFGEEMRVRPSRPLSWSDQQSPGGEPVICVHMREKQR